MQVLNITVHASPASPYTSGIVPGVSNITFQTIYLLLLYFFCVPLPDQSVYLEIQPLIDEKCIGS